MTDQTRTLDLAAEADRLKFLRDWVDALDPDERCELHTLEYTQALRAELAAAQEREQKLRQLIDRAVTYLRLEERWEAAIYLQEHVAALT